jgi:hypothetical protein
MRINLLLIGNKPNTVHWDLGETYCVEPVPAAIQDVLDQHLDVAQAWLFWAANFPLPERKFILALLEQGADVWHAGLKLGTAGQPDFIDFVFPTWMLNRDPDPGIEATSWRLSLYCCLARTEVLRQMGGLVHGFQSLDAAALEMGYRYIRQGVFVRYVPDLLPISVTPQAEISLYDQLRFMQVSVGKVWT